MDNITVNYKILTILSTFQIECHCIELPVSETNLQRMDRYGAMIPAILQAKGLSYTGTLVYHQLPTNEKLFFNA